MRRDVDGNRLARHLEIRVLFPDKIFPDRLLKHNAPPGKGFSDDNVDEMLEQVADQLDALYPFWEFKVQPLSPRGSTARQLISFVGYRALPENTPKQEDSTPVSEAAAEDAPTELVGNTIETPAASEAGAA